MLGVINNQNQYFYFNDNLEEVRQQQIKRIENWVKELKNENEDEKITAKITKWEKELKKIKSNDEKNRITKKQNKLININKAIIENYNFQENNFNLDYTGDYNEEGLDVIIREKKDSDKGKDIAISQKTLKDAIANLATYTKEQNEEFKKLKDLSDRRAQDVTVEENKEKIKKLQTIKNDLVRMIFVTSEAMRFGSHLKYFNYYKDETKKEQFEFKNIQAYVQEVINDLKKSINWKDYTSQLRGGWTKSSKFVEERRKEIFKKLNVLIINNSFISENSEKLNKILENSLRQPQNWKNELNDLIKNFANQEEKDLMIKNFDILHEHNKFRINEEPIDVNNITRLPSVFSSCDTEFGILGNTIISNNLDFVEMLIIKKPELLASKCKNNWTALHLAANTGRMKSVELLLDKAKELYKDKPEEFNKFINSKDIFGSTPLHEATDKAEINKKNILIVLIIWIIQKL